MMKSVTVFAPATIANFNVGYDILGLALTGIGDEVTLSHNGSNKNKIVEIINDSGLPKDLDKNCCSTVVQAMQKEQKDNRGIDFIIKKGFAAGSGLGSSSASSAAAAYAYNELVGHPYSKKELIKFAALGEQIACGTAHIDNVTPSILGGIVLVSGKTLDEIIELPVIENLYVVTLFPKIHLKTSDSRKILKKSIPLAIHSKQTGAMGAFISSLYENNLQRFGKAMKDLIIEPMRSILIPKFDDLKKKAFQNNAVAYGISGSGPTVFCVTYGKEDALAMQPILAKVYDDTGIVVETHHSKITKNSGACIISKNF